jgi:hypothetical protein
MGSLIPSRTCFLLLSLGPQKIEIAFTASLNPPDQIIQAAFLMRFVRPAALFPNDGI